MELANIVPPQWEGLFPQGSYRMALAHWTLSDQGYVKELRKGKGYYLLLDNGAFEGQQVNYRELNAAYTALGADEVVLPDVPGDSSSTLRLSWSALQYIAARRVMFVPQGTTFDEWASCLRAWIDQWRKSEHCQGFTLAIGVASLRKAAKSIIPLAKTRAHLLVEAGTYPYPIHLLGAGIGDFREFLQRELPAAHEVGARGVDTSSAFALAAKGILLTPTASKTYLGPPAEYEQLSTHNRRLVVLNQRILREWVSSGKGSNMIPAFWIRQTAAKWAKYHAEGFASLSAVMKTCGMPKGPYALLKERGREVHVRPLARGEAPRDLETLVEVNNGSAR